MKCVAPTIRDQVYYEMRRANYMRPCILRNASRQLYAVMYITKCVAPTVHGQVYYEMCRSNYMHSSSYTKSIIVRASRQLYA